MDKTNINALVQSIERFLHLIYKNLFSIKQQTNSPPKIGLNLFKESRRTSPLCVRRRLRLYIYPRRPEVIWGATGSGGRTAKCFDYDHGNNLSNVFLGSCWSNEYCVGFSVTFWHGRGKKWIPISMVVFAYDGVPAHLDLAIFPPHMYTAYALSPSLKGFKLSESVPKCRHLNPEI